MSFDVSTIVISLRNSTPLGRLNNTEALAALDQINTLGWTIGGTGGIGALGSNVFDPAIDLDAYNNNKAKYVLIQQVRDTCPAAARIGFDKWNQVFLAIVNLTGPIVIPTSAQGLV